MFQIVKPDINIDFIRLRRGAFAFSGAVIIAGIVSLIVKGGPFYGIDFTGGLMLHVGVDEEVKITEVRDAVSGLAGGEISVQAFRSIAWRGRYLVIGFAQGAIPALPLNLALLKGASLVGVFWGEFAKREPGRNARMLGELAAWYAAGKVKPVLDRVLPMEQLPAAFARMAAREVVGKLVLTNP